MYYIYALFDSINNTPFYIGKGKGDRAYQHLKGKDMNNVKKCETINNLRSLGIEPEVHMIVENIENESLAYSMEYHMIKNAESYGISLTNRVGVDLRPPCRKGTTLSHETRIKISKATKGKTKPKLSEETKIKISNKLKGIEPKRSLKIDEGILRSLYLDKGMSRDEIAKLYNVSLYPINRLMKKFNILKIQKILNKER
jgi:hypothetical protein